MADDEGIDVTRLEVDALLELCHDGSQAACEELDRRGVEPPLLEPDPVVDSDRASALVEIGVRAAGKTIVGLEVDRGGTARLILDGGAEIVMAADGELDYTDGRQPSCVGVEDALEQARRRRGVVR